MTTRPVALVLVELRHAVCRQWAEHVVLDESRLDLYSLRPMSMYRTMMSVHGARKNSTEDSSNAYGSLLASPHVDSSGMIVSSCVRAYTSPICMACTSGNNTWLLLLSAEQWVMEKKDYLWIYFLFFTHNSSAPQPLCHPATRVNFNSAWVKPFSFVRTL